MALINRAVFYALILPLLAGEAWAGVVAHDQKLTTVFALLALAVIVVRWAALSSLPDGECHPDCPKCAESESTDHTATRG